MKQQTLCPQETMERLVDVYGTSMLRTCAAMLKDEDLAQDAVQDAFMKMYLGWADTHFDTPAGERSWVLRVTMNVCRDYLRAPWHQHIVILEELPDCPDPHQEHPVGETSQLYQCILALKPSYRQVILLHYYLDLKLKEIAIVLGISQSTAGVRLQRARGQLKKVLAEQYTG